RDGRFHWGRLIDQTTYAYDGRDDLVAINGGSSPWWWPCGPDGTSFVRDGLGRALTVIEGGERSDRLFAGLEVVAEGSTQVVRDPFGAVQSEVTTTWHGPARWGHAR